MRARVWAPIAVAGAAALVYANSLAGNFVYDDRPIIVENPLVRGPATVAQFLASAYWARGASSAQTGGLYRPFAIWTFAQLWQLGGGKPFLFHATNVLFHALASAAILLLLLRFGLQAPAAAAGAMCFAVMPVHSEAVAWSVGLSELMGAAFFLASWRVLHEASGPYDVARGLLCYLLALMSKESAAPLPAVLVLGELFTRKGSTRSLVEKRLPVWASAFGVLALYLYWRSNILGSAVITGANYFVDASTLVKWLTMAVFFFRGWLLPIVGGFGLCADYNRPAFPDAAVSDVAAWAALISILALFSFAVYHFIKKRSFWSFAVLVFGALALPMLNVVVPMGILGADRFEYLPSVGFAMLFALAWERLQKPQRFALAGALMFWSTLAIARNRVWASDETLFASLQQSAPDNFRALTGMGVQADLAGRHQEARAYFQRALAAAPNQPQAAYDMGKSFYDEGDWRSAKPWFAGLEQKNLADADAYWYLGKIAEKEGKPRDAREYFRKAGLAR